MAQECGLLFLGTMVEAVPQGGSSNDCQHPQVGHRTETPADILSSAEAVPGTPVWEGPAHERVGSCVCSAPAPSSLVLHTCDLDCWALPVGIETGNCCGVLPAWDSQVTLVIAGSCTHQRRIPGPGIAGLFIASDPP